MRRIQWKIPRVSPAVRQSLVVTAFCSLHYLPEPEMAAVIRKAVAMDEVLILQANDAIHNLPAKREDLARLMRENGYPSITIYARPGFTRPLLAGTVTPRHLRPEGNVQ
jgi:hypothetical protein